MKKIFYLSLLLVLLFIAAIVGFESYSQQPSFCGKCHLMKVAYNSWENSKHRDVACVECHYAPGEAHTIDAKFKGLARLFSYLSSKEKEVREKALIQDISCVKPDCHPGDKFLDKKINFHNKSIFVHKTHNEKTIEGQKLHCNTCHMHLSSNVHFEVPKEACFLCHFKATKFNEGRAKCLLCHTLPEEPIQQHGEKPITHQQLKESKVPCDSCHIQIVSGTGEVDHDACFECHDMEKTLRKVGDMKLMHEMHVENQKANCVNCHELIQHKKSEFISSVIEDCTSCHPDHHIFQKILLSGFIGKDDKKTPNPMFASRTNCLGCHIKETSDKKGQKLIKGSKQACVACHSEKHNRMFNDWVDELDRELKDARSLEKEAQKAIRESSGKVAAETLNKAKKMFELGSYSLKIVKYGNGIHNKKYAMMLIDSAFINFEDLIDLLNER